MLELPNIMSRSNKVFNLSPDHFAANSEASATLAKMLNATQNVKLINKIGRHFNQYTAGLNDIMPCQNSTQAILFEMWFERFDQSSREMFGGEFDRYGIELSYYRNVMRARVSKAKEMGAIWQKM